MADDGEFKDTLTGHSQTVEFASTANGCGGYPVEYSLVAFICQKRRTLLSVPEQIKKLKMSFRWQLWDTHNGTHPNYRFSTESISLAGLLAQHTQPFQQIVSTNKSPKNKLRKPIS